METDSRTNGSQTMGAKRDPFSPCLQKPPPTNPKATARSTLKGYVTWLVMCLMPVATRVPLLRYVVQAYINTVFPKTGHEQ